MRKIETAVARILEGSGTRIPVDVEAIAEKLGLTIVRQTLEKSVSGMLVIRGDGGTIGVNESHHPNRQRFTIAHEIGHFVLHKAHTHLFLDAASFYRDERSTDGTSAREKEANIFAAELLMPQDVLEQHLQQEEWFDPMDDVALRRLASQFGVSTQSLLIRLTKLDLIDT